MDISYKRLGKNTVLVFIGKGGSALISLLMLPLYTHWLSPGEYGTVDLITTYSTILLSIVSCCIADALFVVPKGAADEECKKYFSSGLCFVVVQFGLLSLIAAFFKFFGNTESFIYCNLWDIVFLTASMLLANITQQFSRTIDKMTVFSVAGILQTLSIALLSILLIPKFGLPGYIDALILSYFIVALFVFFASKLYCYLSIKQIQLSYIKTLIIYSLPLVPNSIMWWLVNGLNRPIMEAKLGLAALGLYAVAIRFPSLIISLCDVFMNAFSISMIEEYGKETFQSFFNNTFRIIMFVVILCSFFLTIFSSQIISLFADDSFYNAWELLPILSLSSVFSCCSTIVGGVFIAKKKSKYFFYSSIWGAGSSVLFTFVLISLWGITGCAVATCISFLIMYIVRLYYAWKDINGFDLVNNIANLLLLIVSIVFSLSGWSIVFKTLLYVLLILLFVLLNYSLIRIVETKFVSFIWNIKSNHNR